MAHGQYCGVTVDQSSECYLVASEPVGGAVKSVEGPVVSGGVGDDSIVDWELEKETCWDWSDRWVLGSQVDGGSDFTEKDCVWGATGVYRAVGDWLEISGGVEGVVDYSALGVVI
jgi:hypothetical protein